MMLKALSGMVVPFFKEKVMLDLLKIEKIKRTFQFGEYVKDKLSCGASIWSTNKGLEAQSFGLGNDELISLPSKSIGEIADRESSLDVLSEIYPRFKFKYQKCIYLQHEICSLHLIRTDNKADRVDFILGTHFVLKDYYPSIIAAINGVGYLVKVYNPDTDEQIYESFITENSQYSIGSYLKWYRNSYLKSFSDKK